MMKQLVLNEKDLKMLLIILKNSYTINENKEALRIYEDLKFQGVIDE